MKAKEYRRLQATLAQPMSAIDRRIMLRMLTDRQIVDYLHADTADANYMLDLALLYEAVSHD